jgi:hypothetical protein
VFTETLASKRWLEHLKHALLYKRYSPEIEPTFLNVGNVPEGTYELDKINQCFQRKS